MSTNVLKLFIVLIFVVISSGNVQWWQKTVIYQIYPRSFKDTNGDGIGDLMGVTKSLQYIKSSGVGAIWLCPIYKSPMYDFGYDVADFREIDPDYGTMEDFELLIAKAKSLDIKVILDFVPNHSSIEGDWFKRSVNRTKDYENHFVWADGKRDPSNSSNLLPPSNWISVQRKSAWKFNEERGQFYLHQFAVAQADLNYRNPIVIKEMKDVLRFWLNKGVSGFRVDAVPNLFEADPEKHSGYYPDEPRSNLLSPEPNDYEYLDHIYTKDQEETYDMIYQWRSVLDEYEKIDGFPRVMLAEVYSDIKLMMKYFGDGLRNGSQIPFNLDFIFGINKESDARDIKFIIDKWLTYLPIGETSNWLNGNHDNPRMATRCGPERIDIMNMLALILPGVAITYQGEELGMTDGEVSWEESQDSLACNLGPYNYTKMSRDPERTPFQWDDSRNAGFSTGNQTWLPVAKNFKEVNLKAQMQSQRSHYKFYKDLVTLRTHKVVYGGDVTVKVLSPENLAVLRYLPNEPMVLGVINLANTNKTVDLSVFRELPSRMLVYASGLESYLEKGTSVGISDLILSPHEAIVLMSENMNFTNIYN